MPQLRALGFCGADDSVHPHHLVVLAQAYPRVEFGVLFRPDLEGRPRYATTAWVERLSHAMASVSCSNMKLAAHLCGSRVNDVLRGDTAFIEQLEKWGFKRVQINATAVNGVDTSRLAEAVPALCDIISKYSALEFILQKNDETEPLCNGLSSHYLSGERKLPSNLSFLVDESKGTGVAPIKSWPSATGAYPIGYAGGIGPANIQQVLEETSAAAGEHPFWIDMESSLRSIKNGVDVFDLDKCFLVMEAVCEAGLMERPHYLVMYNKE
ncbi:hypothetical protein FisN_6Lh282 [Fistulifera solaris]|uniref:Phosphoribosylanthranilate isomerase n=1 Tax=Fistulifera solaris TaxID=1519565 RepID=A0A1Z5J6A0_FISSO|nr:hypothetical protein FisN_6Lh282 [Fistulifera solaris]|eukprot:GAX09348.1 hypothetical protein FisN_6Lh282 [Fistulifera solaris]